jgi:hypothetical protein
MEEVYQWRTIIDDLKKQVNRGIPKDKLEKVFQLQEENLECFAAKASEVGRCYISKHSIETGYSQLINQAQYASAWKARAIVNKQVQILEDEGIVEISDGSWSIPVFANQQERWNMETACRLEKAELSYVAGCLSSAKDCGCAESIGWNRNFFHPRFTSRISSDSGEREGPSKDCLHYGRWVVPVQVLQPGACRTAPVHSSGS